MDIEIIVEIAKKAMEDKKAENVKVIYIGEISSVADYFVICSASNPAQLEAIVDNVTKAGKNVIVKTFYTMHNVSKTDYEKKMTYVDYMSLNIESLKEALN